MFKPMTRAGNRLRLALDGPSGSGKTYTALRFAFAIARRFSGPVGVIDTEHGSAKLYIGVEEDGERWHWQGVELKHFAPSTYESAIKAAEREGIKVLVIDSLSHAWQGMGGALDQVDRVAGRSGHKGGSFAAWREVTPQHNAMVNTILAFKGHAIVTLRTKTEWVVETDDRGRIKPEQIGTKPIQRDGVEYEFTIVADMDRQHRLTVSKTRCSAIDGQVVVKPGADWLAVVLDWLEGLDEEPHVTEETVTAIKNAAGAAGTTREALVAVLTRLGASKLSDLTPEQGEQLLNRLLSKAASENRVAKISASAPRNNVAGELLAKDVKDLWLRLGRDPQELVAFVRAKGATTLAGVPRDSCQELLRRLGHADLEQQAKQAF